MNMAHVGQRLGASVTSDALPRLYPSGVVGRCLGCSGASPSGIFPPNGGERELIPTVSPIDFFA